MFHQSENIKSLLGYLLGLVGLIGASLLFTNQTEAPEIKPLSATVSPIKMSQAATPSTAMRQAKCTDIAQGVILNYVSKSSTTSNSEDHHLFVSGTIYASDTMSPLSGVLISVWRENPEHTYKGPLPYISPSRTDSTGHYHFSVPESRLNTINKIYYHLSYQNKCHLAMHLDIVTVSSLSQPFVRDGSALSHPDTRSPIGQMGGARAVFHGPVDIVLPVLPPVP